jgi:hypothetical protein
MTTSMSKQLGRCLVLMAFLLEQCSEAAIAAGFKFDPAACKRNTGSFYVALGHYVFETRGAVMGNVVIDPIEDYSGSVPLKVPDPSDQRVVLETHCNRTATASFMTLRLRTPVRA